MSTFTQTETHASIRPEIRFDLEYLKSLNGYLKVGLILLGIINVIIINSSAYAFGFYNFVVGFSLWITIMMLLLFLFHIPEKFYTLPWLPVEIGAICLISLLYFIASLIAILKPNAIATIAGLFGFITTAGYFYSGYLKYKQWKSGELAQGTMISRSTTTSTSNPNQQASAFPA
ncbi:hypothetical protein PVAND_004576 [Polypedilum vanderplanki]|uniref:MARVEL domain-containing protein n=1 Tax=Polypedilum vanderplanki TaxID=319348 RepID=A0A9J6BZI7_POLVA|nr:hypothetical protein PVAND_004576 [Polypedilum vanderplanki]